MRLLLVDSKGRFIHKTEGYTVRHTDRLHSDKLLNTLNRL